MIQDRKVFRVAAAVILVSLVGWGYVLFSPKTKQAAEFKPADRTASGEPTEEIRTVINSIYKACDKKTGECYVEKIKTGLLGKYPFASILAALDDFNHFIGCHAFSHFLGRALLEFTENTADAHALCDFTCFGGCYHGVLEKFLESKPDPLALTGDELTETCRSSKARAGEKPPEQVYGECLHGFGHGFMFVTGGDLPKSLALCDRLPNKTDREACYGGALMENASSSTNPDHPSPWIRAGDNFFPCTVLEEKYLPQCYWYQVGGLLSSGLTFPQIFEECRRIPQEYRFYCFLGIGTNTTSGTKNPVEEALNTCALGRGEEISFCVKGAIISLMGRYGGEALEKVTELCSRSPAEVKTSCYENFKDMARAWKKGHFVILTQDGFSPNHIIIKKGETIIFSTTLGDHFWPASNFHPTHALYSEFDPKRPVAPGESWSFKFEKTGTWGYHDHLTPYLLGTVVVE